MLWYIIHLFMALRAREAKFRFMNDLKKLLDMKTAELRAKCEAFPAAYIPRVKYTDKTANQLTQAVIAYIRLSGGYAERINTMGRIIKTKANKQVYIPTTGTRGSADISAVVNGRAIRIEVKIGADRQSDKQKQYQMKVEQSGGIYMIVKTYEDFLIQWNNI